LLSNLSELVPVLFKTESIENEIECCSGGIVTSLLHAHNNTTPIMVKIFIS
jgi:hypothetical protein